MENASRSDGGNNGNADGNGHFCDSNLPGENHSSESSFSLVDFVAYRSAFWKNDRTSVSCWLIVCASVITHSATTEAAAPIWRVSLRAQAHKANKATAASQTEQLRWASSWIW